MEILLTIIHLIACLILVLVVLIQKGKGADLAGAFGGGGSQTSIGVRTATQLIHKLTIGAAVFFMITSYTLGLTGSAGTSIAAEAERQAQEISQQNDGEETQPPAESSDEGTAADGSETDQGEEQPPAEDNSNEDGQGGQ